MNDNQKKIAIVSVVAALLATAYHKKHQKIILDRFPDLDPKILKKAYNQILRDAYCGRLANEEMTDENLDDLILRKYANLIAA